MARLSSLVLPGYAYHVTQRGNRRQQTFFEEGDYTGFINARHRWTGHLRQGRFGAVVMDEEHLAHAVRYVSLNPVRPHLVERAEDWAWPSVRAHLAGEEDAFVCVRPVLER